MSRRCSNKLLFLIIAIIVLLPSSVALAQTQTLPPEQVAREFYEWYLRAHMPSPKGKNLATFRKYLTQRLIQQQVAPNNDADLLLGDIQDFDPTWKVESVSKATVRGQQANTQVLLKGKEWNHKLRVSLKQVNGVWKIDEVKNAFANPKARFDENSRYPNRQSKERKMQTSAL